MRHGSWVRFVLKPDVHEQFPDAHRCPTGWLVGIYHHARHEPGGYIHLVDAEGLNVMRDGRYVIILPRACAALEPAVPLRDAPLPRVAHLMPRGA